MQEPPKGLGALYFRILQINEADNESNPKFQRIRFNNINMQRYDILYIYDSNYFAIYVQDYKIREQ